MILVATRFRHDVHAMLVAKLAVLALYLGWIFEVAGAPREELTVITVMFLVAVTVGLVLFCTALFTASTRFFLVSYLVLASAYGVGVLFHLYDSLLSTEWRGGAVAGVGSSLISAGVSFALIGLAVNESRVSDD